MRNVKILIFSQTFNNFSGGGITLSNLFKDWPSENLAVLSYPFMLHKASTDICQNYYQIGQEELSWKFPLSIFKQKFKSGKLHFKRELRLSVLHKTARLRHSFSLKLVAPFLRWSSLIHTASQIHISPHLRGWLSDFSPEILYVQISNRESINFALGLIDYLKIPSVLHMMDDWPSTISSRGLFRKYWHKIIDREFRALLDKTNLHLSISDAMSEEYLKRYGKVFQAFHNPVDISAYTNANSVSRDDTSSFRILYFGRVGVANRKSLLFFAKAVSDTQMKPIDVEFDIYTKDFKDRKLRLLGNCHKVKLLPPVPHDRIPSLINHYDVLLLPLDFNAEGLKFARFSIPTKASEYMISGKPILVFAPVEAAISRFFAFNNCGICVCEEDVGGIELALKTLFNDSDFVKNIANNAVAIAKDRFDREKVRSEFQTLLTNLVAYSTDNLLPGLRNPFMR